MTLEQAVKEMIDKRFNGMFGIVVENDKEYREVLEMLYKEGYAETSDVNRVRCGSGFPEQVFLMGNKVWGTKCIDDENLIFFKELDQK